MRINGIALLARKAIVTRRFGASVWNELFSEMGARCSCFRSPMTSTSRVPVDEFLAFHDETIRRLFADESHSYFELGEESAIWALDHGPLESFIQSRDLAQFVKALSAIWQTYFAETSSRCEAKLVGESVEMEASGLPQWHPYFEYFVVGYVKGALGLLYANPVDAIQVLGGRGHGYKYLFRAGLPETRGRLGRIETLLSSRETDVLHLVAKGKTNQEIGMLLGISHRTVEIHVAHIYDKLGVPNRASAILWFAERHTWDRTQGK